MRGNSFLMLGLAVVFGIGAVVVTKFWLDSQRNQFIPSAEATLSPTDTVVVAATALRFMLTVANATSIPNTEKMMLRDMVNLLLLRRQAVSFGACLASDLWNPLL